MPFHTFTSEKCDFAFLPIKRVSFPTLWTWTAVVTCFVSIQCNKSDFVQSPSLHPTRGIFCLFKVMTKVLRGGKRIRDRKRETSWKRGHPRGRTLPGSRLGVRKAQGRIDDWVGKDSNYFLRNTHTSEGDHMLILCSKSEIRKYRPGRNSPWNFLGASHKGIAHSSSFP